MHPRLDELFTRLDTERDALRAAIASVPPERRNLRPAPDRWSVAEILEHLTLVEHGLAGALSQTLAEARAAGTVGRERDTSPVLPTFDFAVILDRSRRIEAPARLLPPGARDADAAWAALVAARAGFKTAMTAGDGLALGDVTYPHRFLGPLSIYGWLAFVAAHEARHVAQVREIAMSSTA